MKISRIDSCSFGSLVINGKTYTEDLVVYPDGKIMEPWRRKRGHQLSIDDLQQLIDSSPEVIVIGTGVSGGVKPDKNIELALGKLGIEFIAAPNEKIVDVYNALTPGKRVGAGFHLTC